jgi:hypothetical protein
LTAGLASRSRDYNGNFSVYCRSANNVTQLDTAPSR